MRKIVVLQHADSEGLGTIQDSLIPSGLQIQTIRGDLGEPVPQSMDDTAALIVMGGPMGVYEYDRYPFLSAEMKLIEAALRSGRPMLGICLGSQLLAAALGSKVRKGPRKEIGWYPVYLEGSDPFFKNAPSTFQGFHWHGDIFDVPVGAVKLAHSDLTECQAFRYSQAYGILFHMEVTHDSIAGMINAFPDEMAEAGVSAAELRSATDSNLKQLQSIGSRFFASWGLTLNIKSARV